MDFTENLYTINSKESRSTRAPDKMCKIIFNRHYLCISSPNHVFDHLLETSQCLPIDISHVRFIEQLLVYIIYIYTVT